MVVVAALFGSGQAASADPVLRVSVTAARLAPGGLQVLLTGRYTCGPFSPGSDGVVDLTVTQDPGTTGFGYLFVTVCDGTAQVWSAPVDSIGGPFARGRAELTGSGYACDRATGVCAFTSFGPTLIRIR
ncbi:hypothetical protein [Actinophytocola sp.]|uniref:hypothetical protein n=1 Tax=Actinophytocola sp. TaxID=1872138 RepID=UPI002D803A18|nr:hypothetical protein [Actinophytocola sp.]HET9138474.1 hypothetical protein [Actinophytocola sp.]